MPGDQWKRLGNLLVARRTQLGYRKRVDWFEHLGIADQSGPRRTIEDVERGRRDNYDDATLYQIELWYRWRTESVATVLRDGAPVPLLQAPALDEVHSIAVEGLADAYRFTSAAPSRVIDSAINVLRLAQSADPEARKMLLLTAIVTLQYMIQEAEAEEGSGS